MSQNLDSKIDPYDLTVYSKGIENYDQVNEYEMYENHEDDADSNNFRACQGLKKLEKINSKIHIINYNADSTEDKNKPLAIRELKTGNNPEKIYNFLFDYAFCGLSKDDQLWLEYFIKKYRFEKIDEPRTDQPWNTRVMICQMRFGMYVDKNKLNHIRGIWS